MDDEWNYLLKIFSDLNKENDFNKKKTEKESERKKYITVSDVLKDLEKIVSRESFYRLYDQMYHEQRDEFDKLI